MEEFPGHDAEKQKAIEKSKELFEEEIGRKAKLLARSFEDPSLEKDIENFLSYLDPRIENYMDIITELVTTTGIRTALTEEDWPGEVRLDVDEAAVSYRHEEEEEIVSKSGVNDWLVRIALSEVRAKLLLHKLIQGGGSEEVLEEYFRQAFLVILYEYGLELPKKYKNYFGSVNLPSEKDLKADSDSVAELYAAGMEAKRRNRLERQGVHPEFAKRRAKQDVKISQDSEERKWEEHEEEIKKNFEKFFEEFWSPRQFFDLLFNLEDGKIPDGILPEDYEI